MRTVFEEDEEEMASQQQGQGVDRELTLSSTTLLAIFFGLVLLCGLFFGLGFTLGRHAPQAVAATPLDSSETGKTGQAALPKPSASSTSSEAGASGPAQEFPAGSPDDAQPEETTTRTSELPAEPVKPVKPVKAADTPTTFLPKPTAVAAQAQSSATTPLPQSYPAVKPTSTAATPPVTAQPASALPLVPSAFMVQIAAVSNPADADVLVGALKKRGYSVTVRHQATDALLHVQIGPFSNRLDAVAMRQKLLADGYNAILK